MLKDKATATAIDCVFTRATQDETADIHKSRIAVIDDFCNRRRIGADEFDIAASLIAGKVLDRAAADHFTDHLMTAKDADAYFELSTTIDSTSSRDTMMAVMVDTGLLPDDRARPASKLEKATPAPNI